MNKITEIAQHKIDYWYYDNDMEMPDSDREHVQAMIIEGYHSGELCCIPDNEDIEVYGWWKIVKE